MGERRERQLRMARDVPDDQTLLTRTDEQAIDIEPSFVAKGGEGAGGGGGLGCIIHMEKQNHTTSYVKIKSVKLKRAIVKCLTGKPMTNWNSEARKQLWVKDAIRAERSIGIRGARSGLAAARRAGRPGEWG
ncbi:hypothetical protein [Alloyangia mangrovi]|uniref:hypothetical protein n=1 Tax=Alloyangia mangrovi TaxID=1779329 RepID=UPI002888FCC4|nr:hypothetical protein [Alloyangia mangrovi]